MEKTYTVNGMTCVICKANVEKCLNGIDGVNSAIVSLMDNEVLIDFDESKVNEQLLASSLKQEGYELVISKTKIDITLVKLFISIILTIVLMYFSIVSMNNPTSTMYLQALFALIIIIINLNYYKSGFKALFNLKPNMDSLVSISSFVAYLYSLYAMYDVVNYHLYFETSAMVLVIVSIGKYIEDKNKKKTTKFIRGLSTLIPMQANLIKDNEIIITPIEDIKKGDHLLIKVGDSIPQDGIVIEGISTVDESLITGESIPSNKIKGSSVIGGTINIDGELIIEVNKVSSQTTLSKIVSLTKKATMSKIPIERVADRIAKYFVYIVLSISLLTFIFWIISTKDIELSLNFALSVLVISCPCALGLATPSAIAMACNTSSKNGVLIKNPEILEIAHKIKNIILDKTGTLTENKLEIIKAIEYKDDFNKVIASLEANSSHPIGKAIKEVYKDKSLIFDSITQVSGEGIIGKFNNDEYYAGNETLLSKHNIKLEKEIGFALTNNYSYIGVGKNDELLGIIYLQDKIKKQSYKAIENLNNRKINLIMATGDNEIVAKNVSDILNIKEYVSNVKPQDKQNIVLDYKTRGITAMVGDGVNDAVALSSADIAITLADGTDIANASSDVSLITNDINDINFLIDLSNKTMKVIKQNLYWALAYNSIFIPLAAGLFYQNYGLKLNPMIGSITMSISSIVVILNALRISKMRRGEWNENCYYWRHDVWKMCCPR